MKQGEKAKWKYLEIKGGAKFLCLREPATIDFGHLLYLNSDEQKLFSSFSSNTKEILKNHSLKDLRLKFQALRKQ
ncbi:MAG: hypothetical protein IPJ03_03115 [Ignavibacteriales bacterium]|nr:hypothetical protein [Ignavibacteriales bacterium]